MKWMLVAIIVAATTGGDVLQADRHAASRRDPRFPSRRARAACWRCWRSNRFIIAVDRLLRRSPSSPSEAGLHRRPELRGSGHRRQYVFETILAKYVLKEHVNRLRWTGAALVACGVALVSL